MSDFDSAFVSRAAFADLNVISYAGRGVAVGERHGLGMATVLARKGKGEALAERLRERFAVELPRGPYRTVAGKLTFAGTGPQSWLAVQEHGGNAFAATLREASGDLAAVCDQSDGFGVLRISGPKVRDALCKLVPLDLHPRAFRIGDVATTVAAHVGVTIWRLDDHDEGWPVLEIAVSRSFAASFWHALTESAAEFADFGSQSCNHLGPSGIYNCQ